MKMIRILSMILLILLTSCFSPTKEELKLIGELNSKHPELLFSLVEGVQDVEVRLNLKHEKIDSINLGNIYFETMEMNLDSTGKRKTNWLYIIVYDSADRYIFTMRDYGDGKVEFFKRNTYK